MYVCMYIDIYICTHTYRVTLGRKAAQRRAYRGKWVTAGVLRATATRANQYDDMDATADGSPVTVSPTECPSLAARYLEKKTRRFFDYFRAPPCFPGLTRGEPEDGSKQIGSG